MPYLIFFSHFTTDFQRCLPKLLFIHYTIDVTLNLSWIFILHSDFLNQAKNQVQIKQKMSHNCYHLKMSCKFIYTKNNLIPFNFLNLSLLLISQYSRHLCASFSLEHLVDPLLPDGPADAEQNRE